MSHFKRELDLFRHKAPVFLFGPRRQSAIKLLRGNCMAKMALSLLFPILIMFACSTQPSDPETYTVKVNGIVQDNRTRAPLDSINAVLKIYVSDGFLNGGHLETIASATTDTSGYYELTQTVNTYDAYRLAFSGNASLDTSLVGYAVSNYAAQTVVLGNQETIRQDIYLEPQAALWLHADTDDSVAADETLAIVYTTPEGGGTFTIRSYTDFRRDVRKLLVPGDRFRTISWTYRRYGGTYTVIDSVYCVRFQATDDTIKF
jgi:hypothetical protein